MELTAIGSSVDTMYAAWLSIENIQFQSIQVSNITSQDDEQAVANGCLDEPQEWIYLSLQTQLSKFSA